MRRRFGWPAFLVSESLAAVEEKLSQILTPSFELFCIFRMNKWEKGQMKKGILGKIFQKKGSVLYVNKENKRKESAFYYNILIYLCRFCTPLQEDGS